MNLPLAYEKLAKKLAPYKTKFLIIGLVSLIPIIQIIGSIANQTDVSDTQGKVLFTAGVFLFWGFGLFMFAQSFREQKQTWWSKQIPTLTNIGRWYGAVFMSIWFSFLVVFTLAVPYVWFKT